MRHSRIVFSCAAVSIFLAAMTDVQNAQAGDADTARSHFESGKRLRDEGDCVHAIPEFDKSLAADKSIGAFYNLGFCHEQLGHKQEAYEAYRHAQQLASAKKDDRLREISGALAALLETPHIRLVLPQHLPEGLQIKVDDQVVPETFHATEMVIFTKNVKTHTVIVTAPGWEERRETVETKAVKAIELRRPQATGPTPTPPPKTETRWTYWHYGGVAAVGVGVISLGIASYYLIEYVNDRSNLDADITAFGCGADLICSEVEEKDPVKRSAKNKDPRQAFLLSENNELEKYVKTHAIAPAIIGGLFIVGGLLVFFIAPREVVETPSKTEQGKTKTKMLSTRGSVQLVPQLSPQRQGLSIMGTF